MHNKSAIVNCSCETDVFFKFSYTQLCNDAKKRQLYNTNFNNLCLLRHPLHPGHPRHRCLGHRPVLGVQVPRQVQVVPVLQEVPVDQPDPVVLGDPLQPVSSIEYHLDPVSLFHLLDPLHLEIIVFLRVNYPKREFLSI